MVTTPASAYRTVHQATRDAVMATRTGSLTGYSVTSDHEGRFEVIGPVPGDGDRVYARAYVTGLLVMATRTGRVPVRGQGDQVRVVIAPARDTGDAAGTLEFVGAFGGVAPRVLFTA